MRWQWRWCAGAILAAAGLASCHGGGATSSDAGDSGGQVGMTADEVCRAAIRVQCERNAVCGGLPVEQCMGLFGGPCPDLYFSTDSNLTVASLSACIDALGARTCTDVAMALTPSCFSGGKRPEGAACAYDWQCSSRACGSGTPCGVCHPGGAPVGAACDPGGCQAGAYCAGVCIDGARVAHNAEGQPCDLGAIPAVGCAGDLMCTPAPSGGTAGTCTVAPGAGQPCAQYGICGAGTVCTSPMGGTCVDPTTCNTGVACAPNSYCKANDGGITCAPRAAVGEPCSPYPQTPTLPLCVPSAFCLQNNAQAKCVLLREVGQTCDDNNVCNGRGSCENATCATSPTCPIDGGAD